jgi:hypothetical protein
MSKGVLASVAALAASAGVAFGQGAPQTAPGAFPTWGGAPAATPPAVTGSAPAGPTNYLPTATPAELPHNGVVGGGPTYYPGFGTTFDGDQPPVDGMGTGAQQVHGAAGGPDHLWIDVEWLAWRVRSMPIAFPLATAGPAASAGILGNPGTRVLFGQENVDYGPYFNVLRLTGGFWCEGRCWGAEFSGFVQEAKSELGNFSALSTGRTALARPLIDALTGQQSAVLVAFPGQFSGDIFINSRLKLGGAEANLLRSCAYYDKFKFNLLGGIRYIDHDETLTITSRSVIPTAIPNDPAIVDIFDEFACRNQFVGANLGFQAELRHRRLFCDFTGKVALGNMNQQLNVRGFTNNSAFGVDTTNVGGMLALIGNIGETTEDEFAYVPEVIVKIGWQWTQRLSTYIGYNGLYMSRVMRPGDQIDPVINPVFLPVSQQFGGDFGPIRPMTLLNKSDFWAQGISFGLKINY